MVLAFCDKFTSLIIILSSSCTYLDRSVFHMTNYTADNIIYRVKLYLHTTSSHNFPKSPSSETGQDSYVLKNRRNYHLIVQRAHIIVASFGHNLPYNIFVQPAERT